MVGEAGVSPPVAVDAKASGDLLPAALCVAEGGRRGNASGNAFGEIAREDLGGFTARATC